MIVAVALVWLAVINCWTILAWRQDKRSAIAGLRRHPESNLLLLALIGGTPGAFLGRHLYRHKTRKQPFVTWLFLIAAIQLGVAIAFLIPIG